MCSRTWKIALFVLILSTLLVPATFAQAKKPVIAFAQSTMTHPWRVTETNDLKAWADKLGANFIWNEAKMDAATQLKNCEDLLAKKPDVLILDPISKDGLAPVADLATKAGVPLIVIDSVIAAEPGKGTFISMLTKDFVQKGRDHAKLMARALTNKKGKPEGKVFYLDSMPGMSAFLDMLKGFQLEIAEHYPGITIVDRQSGADVRGPSMKVIENALQRFPKGQLDGIVCANDEEAFGAIDAVREAGRTELLGMIIGQVGSRAELRRIVLGEIFGTTEGTPYYGEMTIKTAMAYLHGEKIPPRQTVVSKVYCWDSPDERAAVLDRYVWQEANKAYY